MHLCVRYYPDEHLLRQAEGMVEKINGVSYASYLENPNDSGYEINWKEVLTDPDQLLGFIGLKRVEEVKPEPLTGTRNKTGKNPEGIQKEAAPNNLVLWIGLAVLLVTGLLFTYFKVKKR